MPRVLNHQRGLRLFVYAFFLYISAVRNDFPLWKSRAPSESQATGGLWG